MTRPAESLISLLDRAAEDPALLAELAADPLGVMTARGIPLTSAGLKQAFGLIEASDQEFVEVLRTRLRRETDGCTINCVIVS